MRWSRDFAASRVTLDDGTILTKCDQCETMHRERRERGVDSWPPCDQCRVDLDPANRDAAEVFQTVQGQVITRHNGQYDEVVDLNFIAVKTIMDLYCITDQRRTFEKVTRCFHYFREQKE